MRHFLWLFATIVFLGAPNAWPKETDDSELSYAVAGLESLSARRLSKEEVDAILAKTPKAIPPERIVATSIHTCGYATAVFGIIDATTTTPKTMAHETRIPHTCEPNIDFAHDYYFLVIKDEKVSLALPIHVTLDEQEVIFVSEEGLRSWEKWHDLNLQELREHISPLSPPAPDPDYPDPTSPESIDLVNSTPEWSIVVDEFDDEYVSRTVGVYVERLVPIRTVESSAPD